MANRLGAMGLDLATQIPDKYPAHQAAVRCTLAGENPNLPGIFTKFLFPNGTRPHCPHTDLEEHRPSITIQYKRAGEHEQVAHLFEDGTIKTKDEMHAENNRRRAEQQRLELEEKKFPLLNQTIARQAAYSTMLTRIRQLREDPEMSLAAKLADKQIHKADYQQVLHEQAQARFKAAREDTSREPSG